MKVLQQKTTDVLFLIACMAFANLCHSANANEIKQINMLYAKKETWQQTVLAVRQNCKKLQATQKEKDNLQKQLWRQIEKDFPVEWDWASQDYGIDFHKWFNSDTDVKIEQELVNKVLDELGAHGRKLAADFEQLCQSKVPPNDNRWLDLYVRACQKRRGSRLQPLLRKSRQIVFTKHYNLGGSHYAYTEAQSDAQDERTFVPGSALCLLEMNGNYGNVTTLIDDPNGIIRDPDVSFDGRRILFAWKKSDHQDDYHLYEMEIETGKVRQLTFGQGFADYEGAYLPNDDIIFNSTRCVQIVDCWKTEVSNLYTCDRNGKYLRRLSFDQVHTNFPTVLDDGRVIYTRWDYNDRGQIYPQPLFQMNSDGTGQTEFYGNNSWFPTTILHARGIPGTQKILAVLSGHHCHQRGKLAIIDRTRGNQENSGVQLIAPVRKTEAVRIDSYGQDGEQFQYPYPITETTFLATYEPHSGGNRRYISPYAIYFMDVQGHRELLVADKNISCNQSIPLVVRKKPHIRPSQVDYRNKTGTYYIQDIYAGPGLAGIARGTVKRLRVVALDFRAAYIGSNTSNGPAGGAMSSTPVSIGNGTWDVKRVLGEAKVYEDGSAFFIVPARTPVYFQALDDNGYVIQSMRSWSALQPGEKFSCVGCHESKNQAPLMNRTTTMAVKAGAQTLKPFYAQPRGFSFIKEVQPILDRHCTNCHTRNNTETFSLSAKQTIEAQPKRKWSDAYLELTNAYRDSRSKIYIGKSNDRVNWISVQSPPPCSRHIMPVPPGAN
ncbi:MAG: hypothetical protein FVQ84_17460 [Planctomycetes bacterium]|nr:hypothetical protein [Planctomycetota bacterium]